MGKCAAYQREPPRDAFDREVALQRGYFLRAARRHRNGRDFLDYEDLLQDALLSSWNCVARHGMPDTRESFRFLVLNRIFRKAIDYDKHDLALSRRLGNVPLSYGREGSYYEPADYWSDPLKELIAKETAYKFIGRLEKIAVRNPAVIHALLLYLEGRSNEEIAFLEHKTTNAVNSLLNRVRRRHLEKALAG